jgi:cob(I)alamin adenosyltransferase
MPNIYTRTGDAGQTGLLGGSRVPKNHVRVEAIGAVDEANAVLGIILARMDDFMHRDELEKIQGMLFEIGALLADPNARRSRPNEGDVTRLEFLIDELSATLPPQTHFILPGGTSLAATVHFARTVVRQAERRVTTVSQHGPVPDATLKYLNRLSDYLHVLARAINQEHGVAEKLWHPLAD